MNIQMYLKDQGVRFEALVHAPAYDAQRMAQTLHMPGHEVAKTVLVRSESGDDFFVAVLPATKHVDLQKASVLLGTGPMELAAEVELIEHCPDCEVGALPPFGSQYGMKTLLEATLAEEEEIVFEGNTHHESIRLKTSDFCRLEHPLVGAFAYQAEEHS